MVSAFELQFPLSYEILNGRPRWILVVIGILIPHELQKLIGRLSLFCDDIEKLVFFGLTVY